MTLSQRLISTTSYWLLVLTLALLAAVLTVGRDDHQPNADANHPIESKRGVQVLQNNNATCGSSSVFLASSSCSSTTTTTTTTATTDQQNQKGQQNRHQHQQQQQKQQTSKKNYTWIPESEHPCTIERYTLDELFQTFGPHGVPSLHPYPLVIDLQQQQQQREDRPDVIYPDYANHHVRNLTHPLHLLDNFPPNFHVTLSSSNSFSQHRRTIPLSQYLDEMWTKYETTPDDLSNQTWYLFGETYTSEWQHQLLRHYQLPPCQTCVTQRRSSVALAFGLGNRGSGVQWHVHGPGFSQALHGRKHWILAADKPIYHPNTTSRYWMEYEYPKYVTTTTKRFHECTILPGDLLYFPNHWHHATINLDPYTAFVSSFTTEHGLEL